MVELLNIRRWRRAMLQEGEVASRNEEHGECALRKQTLRYINVERAKRIGQN